MKGLCKCMFDEEIKTSSNLLVSHPQSTRQVKGTEDVMWGVHTVWPDTIVELPGGLQQLVPTNVVWLSAKYAMAIDEQEMKHVWTKRNWELKHVCAKPNWNVTSALWSVFSSINSALTDGTKVIIFQNIYIPAKSDNLPVHAK